MYVSQSYNYSNIQHSISYSFSSISVTSVRTECLCHVSFVVIVSEQHQQQVTSKPTLSVVAVFKDVWCAGFLSKIYVLKKLKPDERDTPEFQDNY